MSASKRITGLTLFGSSSLLAFLIGSALGLALVVAARHYALTQALVGVPTAVMLSSVLLLVTLEFSASSVWNSNRAILSGISAWLFFGLLVMRCALWFASRALRSDLAASVQVTSLGLTESSYFGFIIGLLLGRISIAGQGYMVSALLLDVFLLSLVAASDLSHWY